MSNLTLSLTVAHLPTACSFYLSTLQPLGFHYVCEDAGCVGLGSKGPSLYLCQGSSSRVSRTKIVFSAEDRISVREVYAAALEAGALPSQPPEYRNSDTGEFGAAIFDFDGNVIEAVYPGDGPPAEGSRAPKNGSILTWSQDVANQSAPVPSHITARTAAGDARSAVDANRSVTSRSVKSTIPNEIDGASSVKTTKTTAPAKSTIEGDKVGQTLATTLLGAAAGAAIAYGWSKVDDEVWKKESADAKSEAEAHFAKEERSSRGSKLERRRSASVEPTRSVARSQTFPIAETPPSRSQRAIEAPPSRWSRISHRDPTVVDRVGSERSRHSARAIEAPPPKSVRSQSATRSTRISNARPSEFVESRSVARSTSLKSHRDQTAASATSFKSPRSTRTVKSSGTSRGDKAPTEVLSRRTVVLPEDDSVPAPKSIRSVSIPSAGMAGVSEMVKGMHNAYERANQLYNEFQDFKAGSIPSPASRANSDAGRSRRASAADIPLPASKANSRVSRRSAYHSAVEVPASRSKANDVVERVEYYSAAGVPLPESRQNSSVGAQSYLPGVRNKAKYPAGTEIALPESTNEKILDDLETLAPEDSASRAGSPPPLPAPRHRWHSNRSSRHSDVGRSRDRRQNGYEYIIRPYAVSEAGDSSTITPGKRPGRRDSGVSLPVRPRRRISFGRGKGSLANSAF
ncbi:MAG: hypothetical protein Q9165_001376 [Trypethelium subeluteriae]